MHSTTVAVDLAKNVFELAVADAEGKLEERLRLNRARFSSFFVHRAPCRVLMEACGSAHYWARRIGELAMRCTYARAARSDPPIAVPDAQRGQGARTSHRADRALPYSPHSCRSGGSEAASDPGHRLAQQHRDPSLCR